MVRIESFGKNVDRYEVWFDHNRAAYESELEVLRALLPKSGEGLEVGVGTGRFAAPLGVRVGVDPSSAMGKVAMERGIEVHSGVGENLPYQNSSFEFVVLVTTICFLDDVPAAFGEAYRVLTPGGCILVGFIDRESTLGKVYEKRKQDSEFYRQATFLSLWEGFKNPWGAECCFRRVVELTEDGEPVHCWASSCLSRIYNRVTQ